MCEIIKSTKTTKIRKERTVFKVFHGHSLSSNLFSPIKMKSYFLNKQAESRITFLPSVSSRTVKTEEGLYSFKTKESAKKFKTALENTYLGLYFVIVECTIPIGSLIIDCDDNEHRYYPKKNCSGVIISNKLIPIEIVN